MQAAEPHVPPERWAAADDEFRSRGFGFVPYDFTKPDGDFSIGTTVCSPSWVMKLVQDRPDVRVISFQEAGWVGAHDVLVLQRRPAAQG